MMFTIIYYYIGSKRIGKNEKKVTQMNCQSKNRYNVTEFKGIKKKIKQKKTKHIH